MPSPSSSLSSSDSSPRPTTTRAVLSDTRPCKAAKTAKKAEMIRARKAWTETCKQHKPCKWIGKRLLPSDTNKPPLLHFGFGVKASSLDAGESLVRYAKEVGFYEERRGLFELEIIVPYSLKHGVVVAVYSNWDVEDSRLPPKEEKEIFDAIRQAIGDPEQVPLWYHDSLEKEGQWRILPRSRPFKKPTTERSFSNLLADFVIGVTFFFGLLESFCLTL
ncbi:hypothetical protein K488DRAFT_73295 [Vararia minispora EC-137]|uniref:Uncharacterized protein n=1 Tax=Vararia minispora EC-137 TaxID=1314806 RepID=A0ACB8QBT7_9AGAM|nr:hypothetical protein K488DRAFT_73295 [Vararia minispora EC-137]